MEEAAAFTGLSDFGDPWFEKPLSVLLEALHTEAKLNFAGRLMAKLQFSKVLRDRLWAEKWFADYPEILARPMRRPVIIVGPMRTGTTRLHRLLASDRRFSYLRNFETIGPVPWPGFTHGGPDPRIDQARRVQIAAKFANSRTLAIHPTGPLQPEEELGLLCNSMWSMKHEAQWHVPSYGRWSEGVDPLPAYAQMARLLKLVGWSQQSSSLRPWVLKTPQHMMDLPALLSVFPDARLIFTHRDLSTAVASAASLAWNQSIIYSDHIDPEKLGAEWLRKTQVQIERVEKARKSIPQERMMDVHFDEMESDWRATMERIYRFLDLDIAPALPALEEYQRRTANGKARRHDYCLAEFGLSKQQVEGAFLSAGSQGSASA